MEHKRLTPRRKGMKEKIYKNNISCAMCHRITEEYKEYQGVTIRSWYVLCSSCFRSFESRIEKLERKVFR